MPTATLKPRQSHASLADKGAMGTPNSAMGIHKGSTGTHKQPNATPTKAQRARHCTIKAARLRRIGNAFTAQTYCQYRREKASSKGTAPPLHHNPLTIQHLRTIAKNGIFAAKGHEGWLCAKVL